MKKRLLMNQRIEAESVTHEVLMILATAALALVFLLFYVAFSPANAGILGGIGKGIKLLNSSVSLAEKLEKKDGVSHPPGCPHRQAGSARRGTESRSSKIVIVQCDSDGDCQAKNPSLRDREDESPY